VIHVALSLAIGFVSGLRTFTGPAVVSWFACHGRLNLQDTPLQFMSSRAAVVIFSLLALVEYVGDKLPRTPNRTNPGPLVGRILFGGLSGAALAVSGAQSLAAGAVLGGIGAVIGAHTGYQVRKRLVARLGVKDFYVALPEDLVAIGLACLIVASL